MEDTGSPPQPPGAYFTPLLISTAGIVATSLAIVAYHLIMVRFCLHRRRIGRDLESGFPDPISGGVDDKVLDTIPILSYSSKKPDLFLSDHCECAVCLADLEDGETVRLLPNCKHAFHVPCIDEWFVAHTSCPVCRSPIVPEIINLIADSGESSDAESTDRVVVQVEPRNDHENSDHYDDDEDSRHCRLFVLPEGLLKRSLSMDQCYLLTINVQTESDHQKSLMSPAPSSSTPLKAVLVRSRSYKIARIRQLDRMSTMLLRYLGHQLRMGRCNGLLPY